MVHLSLLERNTLNTTVIPTVLDRGSMWGEEISSNDTNLTTATSSSSSSSSSLISLDLSTSVTNSVMTLWMIYQDIFIPVPLYPMIIAGFVGMMINVFDSLPYNGTDGGRMYQGLLRWYP